MNINIKLIGLAAVMVVVLVFGGCRDKLEFSHKIHTQEADCLDCHDGADAEEAAGMPAEEECLECHSETEKVRYQKFAKDHPELVWKKTIESTGELIFSHGAHADADVECQDCHVDIEKVVKGKDAGIPRMKECMVCHAEHGLDNDCITCHEKYRKDVEPEDHKKNWKRIHGLQVKGDVGKNDNCSVCHTQASCIDCHHTEKPLDHTQMWKERGHGTMSKLDRRRCMTCHEADYCARCHSETLPR